MTLIEQIEAYLKGKLNLHATPLLKKALKELKDREKDIKRISGKIEENNERLHRILEQTRGHK